MKPQYKGRTRPPILSAMATAAQLRRAFGLNNGADNGNGGSSGAGGGAGVTSTPIITGGAASSSSNSGGSLQFPRVHWSRMTAAGAPCPRQGHSANSVNSKLVVFGGANASTFFNDVHELDVDACKRATLHLTACDLTHTPPPPSCSSIRELEPHYLLGGTAQAPCSTWSCILRHKKQPHHLWR